VPSSAIFVWRTVRGVKDASPALYHDGLIASMESYETILARHELTKDERRLTLAELARRYPYRGSEINAQP
jgi:hypothetical protein